MSTPESAQHRSRGLAPIYPFLLAAYPALALAATNAQEIRFGDILRPLAISLVLALVVFGAARLLLRNREQAALATAWIMLLFFSYGHVYQLLERLQLGGEPLGRHRYLVPVWIALAGAGLWLIAARRLRASSWTLPLNLVTAALVAIPLLRLGAQAAQAGYANLQAPEAAAETTKLTPPEDGVLPDIYYIILDGYGREDVLQNYYGYDNREFIDALRSLGFYVADESLSNYAQTALSLGSSLNYEYLSELGVGLDPNRTNRTRLGPLVQQSRIVRDLDSLGYTTVAFETGFPTTELRGADVYLSHGLRGVSRWKASGGVAPLEAMLIDTTALKVVTDAAKRLPEFLSRPVRSPYDNHRERILFVLHSLQTMPSRDGPKFVFAHLVSPHAPYIFGPNGEEVTPSKAFTLALDDAQQKTAGDREGYVDQVRFLNTRVLEVVNALIEKSDTPPVILLQADHGPPNSLVPPDARMAILNAYYLPDAARSPLYPEVSPVNSFRIILNQLFGSGLPLLADEAYFSGYSRPFLYTRVDDAAGATPAQTGPP